jgi:regulator of sirC expression with transglutaminase-like and TPR domain
MLANQETTMTDLAQTNLNLACGLPGSEALDVARYVRQLDEWARLVATKTERWLPMFNRSAAEFDNSLAKFQMMALVTVLQRDLGVRYDPACQDGAYCALDPRTLFIHGLLDGHGGTCVTMPILYIAIGRRLGYPLHLVQAREHFFVRWEEPGGERFNIEATTLGFTPRDDEHFRHWPKPIRDEEVRLGLFLRNLSPREEVAAFFRERGQCWLDHLRTGPALEAFAEAARLAPQLLGVQCSWAVASILHRTVEYFGRDVLFATPAADIRLPASLQAWEPQVRPLALEQLRRIVSNYRERNLFSGSISESLAFQS